MTSLADVIDLAINKHLWDGTIKLSTKNVEFVSRDVVLFSCEAVYVATNKDDDIAIEIENFLQSMGCNPRSFNEFDEFSDFKDRQYARALWLTWAAMIAREEEI